RAGADGGPRGGRGRAAAALTHPPSALRVPDPGQIFAGVRDNIGESRALSGRGDERTPLTGQPEGFPAPVPWITKGRKDESTKSEPGPGQTDDPPDSLRFALSSFHPFVIRDCTTTPGFADRRPAASLTTGGRHGERGIGVVGPAARLALRGRLRI